MTTGERAASSTLASATCKRIGRDASPSYRYYGNYDRGSAQFKFLHGQLSIW
jgi:hypothetical protein